MRALIYDGTVKLASGYPVPERRKDESVVRVSMAGICSTDLEITKGYMGFRGVMGHEFVGVVEQSEDPEKVGKRVVGEINCGCRVCSFCTKGLEGHCPDRTVLGIVGRDGAFGEYLSLPTRNLHGVPEGVSDEEAVFAEPLAASLEILEQVSICPTDRVAVLGDGKLGLLVGQVLGLLGCELVVFGKHREKLMILEKQGIHVRLSGSGEERGFDVVVEATGAKEGFATACGLVRPRGKVVLKTTVAGASELELAPLVIHEIEVVGSRCGPFEPAIRLLERGRVDVKSMISEVFPLKEGMRAMERAAERGMLKVLLRMA